MLLKIVLIVVRVVLSALCFVVGVGMLMLAGIAPSIVTMVVLSCVGTGILFLSYAFISFVFKKAEL